VSYKKAKKEKLRWVWKKGTHEEREKQEKPEQHSLSKENDLNEGKPNKRMRKERERSFSGEKYKRNEGSFGGRKRHLIARGGKTQRSFPRDRSTVCEQQRS